MVLHTITNTQEAAAGGVSSWRQPSLCMQLRLFPQETQQTGISGTRLYSEHTQAEAGGTLWAFRSAWSAERAPDQSVLLSEILSQNIKIKWNETKWKEKRKWPGVMAAIFNLSTLRLSQTGPWEEAEIGSSVQGQLGLCEISRTARAVERACSKNKWVTKGNSNRNPLNNKLNG